MPARLLSRSLSRSFALVCFSTALLSLTPARSEEIVHIGGTGMGLATASKLGELFSATEPGIRVEVLPSLGSSGGLKALRDNVIQIAIAARELTVEERGAGLRDAACLRTGLVFATSHPKPNGVTRVQLPAIYSDPAPKWADGMPLKIILRARQGATEMPYLSSRVPGLEAAFNVAWTRRGIPVGPTDQINAELAERTAGSFAIVSLLQIKAENSNLRAVPLDGIEPNADTIADGRYPFPLRMCMVLGKNSPPAAERLIAFARSGAGTALFRSLGATAAE